MLLSCVLADCELEFVEHFKYLGHIIDKKLVGDKDINLRVANPTLRTYVANGVGVIKAPAISQLLYKVDIISTAIPPVSGTPIPMEILVKLPDATGSGKSKDGGL